MTISSIPIPLYALFALCSYAVYNILAIDYSSKILHGITRRNLATVSTTIINTLVLVTAKLLLFPVFSTYMIACAILAIEFKILSKDKKINILFCTISIMLHIICIQMIVAAVFMMVFNKSAHDVFMQRELSYVNIAVTFIISIIYISVLSRVVSTDDIKLMMSKKDQLMFCTFISLVICGFTLIDCYTYNIKEHSSFLPYFLLLSSLMTLAVYYLSISYGINICKLSTFKDKYIHLEKELKEQEEMSTHLKSLVFIDQLTGVYSRRYTVSMLETFLQTESTAFSVAFIDLDGLKSVNDNFGHPEGDEYIVTVAKIIKECVRADKDIIGRMGGDEFMILFPACKSDMAEGILVSAYEEVNRQTALLDKTYNMSISYGFIQVDPGVELSYRDIVEMADSKMYEFKKAHKLNRGLSK